MLFENGRCLSLLFVNSFMQVSVDVNEPFPIKCFATTQTKALRYIYCLLMINTLFVESTENIQCCSSLQRRLNFDHVPGNEKDSIFHQAKNIYTYILQYLDWPKLGFVQAKNYLASQRDQQPAVRYFEPCMIRPLCILLLTFTWPIDMET